MQEPKDAISVTMLGTYLKNIIDSEIMLQNIKVFGELGGVSKSGTATYFTVKDEGAVLNCVCFYPLELGALVGKKVIVSGSPKYYVKGGRFNFQVTRVEELGEGELYKKFLLLKEQLTKEGLFDLERKKQMPTKITKIGVVSSDTGAVIQDIINITTRRNKNVSIVLYPVKVQGVGSEHSIVVGIEFFNNYQVDAVVVARGGGGEEDLQPFNTEIVARATANSNKFIVSAVGHETDFTLIDYACDLRAPTPSAAAELLVPQKEDQMFVLKGLFNEICDNAQRKLVENQINLENNYYKAEGSIDSRVLALTWSNETRKNMVQIFENYLFEKERKFILISNEISNNNPINILNRGYLKVSKEEKSVSKIEELQENDTINISFVDGNAFCEVKKVVKN